MKEKAQKHELGKISEIRFGMGGRDDYLLGVSITFTSEPGAWGVSTFIAVVSPDFVDTLLSLFAATKKNDLNALVGTPVKVTFENGVFVKFRPLTEVL